MLETVTGPQMAEWEAFYHLERKAQTEQELASAADRNLTARRGR